MKLNQLVNLKALFLTIIVNSIFYLSSYSQGQIVNTSNSILSVNGIVSFHGDLTVGNGNDFVSYSSTRAWVKGDISVTADSIENIGRTTIAK